MDLSKTKRGSKVSVEYTDGVKLTGIADDFTSSCDNDDEGDYLVIIPIAGKLKGEYVQANEHEVKTITEL